MADTHDEELVVKTQDSEFLGCIFIENGVISFSKDTDELFQEAIQYLVDNESSVIYKNDAEQIIRAKLHGHSHKTLEVLKDFLHYSSNYDTCLQPSSSIYYALLKAKQSRPARLQCKIVLVNEGSWYPPSTRAEYFLTDDEADVEERLAKSLAVAV
jgi:hypothetical protein